MHQLSFNTRYRFDDRQDGITVPVLLRTAHRSVDLLAKIDSGADCCLFQRDYAAALSINVSAGERTAFRTVTGPFEAFGHELTLEVLGLQLSSLIYCYADPEIAKNVLGRRGFLNLLRLGLVEHDSTLYCSAYDDQP